jgi:hypothetical protein
MNMFEVRESQIRSGFMRELCPVTNSRRTVR